TVGDEQVADVPGLAVLVRYGGLRLIAHACRANFVDDLAALRDHFFRGLVAGLQHAPHAFDDFLRSRLEMPDHVQFMLRPFEMKPERWNAPAILRDRKSTR